MHTVIFLPGVITPAAVTFAPLVAALEGKVEPVLKELELYSGAEPPPAYRLELEISGILRRMDAAGLDRAHFVGYSGGGAVCLAFTAAYPERLLSLAIFEPATIPSQAWMTLEPEEWEETERVMALPEEERLPLFIRNYLKPGVDPPARSSAPPPPWMAKRPAGMQALVQALRQYDFAPDSLRAFDCPVYLAYGLSSRDTEERKIAFLADLFPNVEVESYPGLHHFSPPHRDAPDRYARALRRLWNKSG
jgi:pimeloyl-ACP methyl ester carboxylesterase